MILKKYGSGQVLSLKRLQALATGAGALLFCVLLFTVFAAPAISENSPLNAKEILDKVDDLFRGESSHGKITMIITTAHWKRSLTVEAWSKGKDYSLMRILAPKKEKGTATLRAGNNIWNYLPKINRVIKLPSSMMASSWMGSHFTNDDLVKESRMADDYTFKTSFEGKRDGRRVIEITCTPKDDATVVWGKLLVTVDTSDYVPLDIKYYDEDLVLARTIVFGQVGMMGGRKLPKRLTVNPADKPDESTVIIYEDMKFNINLNDRFFSKRNLKR